MRLKVHDFSKGLWAIAGKEQAVPGSMRRARGMSLIRRPSLKSRWGSTQLYALTAHSLFRFNDVRFAGVGTAVYRDGISILTGLNGNRLAFTRMPPQVAKFDSLFVAGGALAKKIDTGGGVTNWGISAPATDFSLAAGSANTPNGTYQYLITFLNSTTGSRSNPNLNAQSITVASQLINLTNIPTSSDPQVDRREIYRTQANGAKFFRLATIADNVTTTYADGASDGLLESVEVQFDNAPPETSYEDAVGPYVGRMWWTRDMTSGRQGRVYYSPEGRPESVVGFIDVVNPDDNTQKLVIWNEQLWLFTESGLFRILGDTEPFRGVRVAGVPGTNLPFTAKATPYGIAYVSYDGPRLFDGNTSTLIGFSGLGPLFRGEPLENLTAFTAIVGEYSRDEYLISDGSSQGLAIHLKDGSWRDLGVGPTALFQEPDTKNLLASFSSKIGIFDDPTILTDFGSSIPLEWEIGGALSDISQHAIIQRIFIDIDTNNQALTPTLIKDNTTFPLASFQANGRTMIEYSPNQEARLFSLRLAGNVSAQVELFGIEMDVYIPGQQ